MRNISVFVLVAATSLPSAPLLASQLTGAAPLQGVVVGRSEVSSRLAQINGNVITPNGEPVASTTVRARNLLSGDVGGSTSTDTRGQFALTVNPGSYMLEVVEGGQIVGTSSFISAAAGTALTTTVTLSTGASAVGGATGLLAGLGAGAARSLAFAAAAASVAGVMTAQDKPTASPSR
jgi:hypothetical protein